MFSIIYVTKLKLNFNHFRKRMHCYLLFSSELNELKLSRELLFFLAFFFCVIFVPVRIHSLEMVSLF